MRFETQGPIDLVWLQHNLLYVLYVLYGSHTPTCGVPTLLQVTAICAMYYMVSRRALYTLYVLYSVYLAHVVVLYV